MQILKWFIAKNELPVFKYIWQLWRLSHVILQTTHNFLKFMFSDFNNDGP
jgi:hypothetical protein